MRTLSFAVLAALSAGVFAANGDGVQAGPFRVKPTIGLTLGHESNVGLSATNEVDSFVTRVSPGIRFDAGSELRNFALSYEIDAGRYADSKIDNYTDHNLILSGRLAPSARLAFDGEAHYNRGHDRRGENSRQGRFADLAIEPDEYDRKGASAGVTYGATGARAGLGARIGTDDLTYQNNRSFTRQADRSEDFISGEFLYRLGAKTRAFVGARRNDIDYDVVRTRGNTTLDLDSRENIYSLGVAFDPSAKVSGRAAVQRIEKDFDRSGLSDFSGTGYEVGLQFRPRSYSVFDLSASRRTDEAVNFIPTANFAAADTQFLLARDITLAWTHGWSDRFRTSVDLGQSNEDYRVGEATRRDDRLNFWGLSAGYQMRSWLNIGAGYRNTDRSSDDRQFDYDNDEFLVSFEASL
jgi:polysaccharide biosynthesis protein VpsM